MKILNLLVIFCLIFNSQDLVAQKNDKYPIDQRTNKICFTDTVSVGATKEQLFKRVEQFVVSQNFDRVENIRCKDKSHVALKIVYQPISYSDFEEGKYLGNGFVNFEYRGNERFVLIFKFKVAVKDNLYKYEITDFKVWEFVTAPKNTSKGKNSGFAGSDGNGAFGVGSASGFVEFSANDVRKWDLEKFSDKRAFDRKGSDDVFHERIVRLVGDLAITMKENF